LTELGVVSRDGGGVLTNRQIVVSGSMSRGDLSCAGKTGEEFLAAREESLAALLEVVKE
jgi:hypothetical protein